MHTFLHRGEDEVVSIHHNGDYSGDAVINYQGKTFAVPCAALVAFSRAAITDRLIEIIEGEFQ